MTSNVSLEQYGRSATKPTLSLPPPKLAFRVAHAETFGEGNKRTALLLARWLLDHNSVDGEAILPVDDEALGDLLVKAASGVDVEAAIIELLTGRQ